MPGGRTPEERFYQIINDLQARVNALEARPVQIPMVDEDPPVGYTGNVWGFQDGRVKVRLPDGTVKEITAADSSGDTSVTPKPVTPPQPTLQQATWAATWTQAYRQSGGFTGGDQEKLYYGNSGASSYNGRQSSLIGFDYGSIASTLSGATVNGVRLYLYNEHTWAGSGGTVHFGLHGNATKPATFSGVVANFVSKDAVHRSSGAWHPLSTQFGALLRDGTAKGIVLQSPNDSTSYYGYAAGLGDGPPIPVLEVTYTK